MLIIFFVGYIIYKLIKLIAEPKYKQNIYYDYSTSNNQYQRNNYNYENGYFRWLDSDRLVHRRMAYKYIYKPNIHEYTFPFSDYVIHLIDGNKINNEVENLQILTPEEHLKIHNL